MRRYQVVHALVHATIAGILYLFLRVVVDDPYPKYHAYIIAYRDYIIAGGFLVLPFLFNRSAFIANLLIEKVPYLSVGIRRVLSGKDFIEGDWPLIVLDRDKKTPRYFGFLTITYEGGQLLVYGDDWNPDGSHAVKYRSQQSRYADRKLEYWYAQGRNTLEPTMFGYTRIYFFPEQGRIERHAGEFIDKENSCPPFVAKRICNGIFGRRLSTKDEKLKAAKRLWLEIEPKIKDMRELRIDLDFV